jgi:hypothetical protein
MKSSKNNLNKKSSQQQAAEKRLKIIERKASEGFINVGEMNWMLSLFDMVLSTWKDPEEMRKKHYGDDKTICFVQYEKLANGQIQFNITPEEMLRVCKQLKEMDTSFERGPRARAYDGSEGVWFFDGYK